MKDNKPKNPKPINKPILETEIPSTTIIKKGKFNSHDIIYSCQGQRGKNPYS